MIYNFRTIKNDNINDDSIQTCSSILCLLSHEIRNPLANIITYSDYYKSDLVKLSVEEKDSLVSNIQKDAHKLLTTMDNILVICKLISTELSLHKESIDSVLKQAINRIKSNYPDILINLSSIQNSFIIHTDVNLLSHAFVLIFDTLYANGSPDSIINCSVSSNESEVHVKCTIHYSNVDLSTITKDILQTEKQLSQLIITSLGGIISCYNRNNNLTYDVSFPFEEGTYNV